MTMTRDELTLCHVRALYARRRALRLAQYIERESAGRTYPRPACEVLQFVPPPAADKLTPEGLR